MPVNQMIIYEIKVSFICTQNTVMCDGGYEWIHKEYTHCMLVPVQEAVGGIER